MGHDDSQSGEGKNAERSKKLHKQKTETDLRLQQLKARVEKAKK